MSTLGRTLPFDRNSMAHRRLPMALTLVCAVLLAAASLLAASAREPNFWSPFPLAQFFLLTNGWPQWLCTAAALASFAAVGGTINSPRRGRLYTSLILSVLTVLSVAYFAARFSTGLAHQGLPHVSFMIAVNALALGFLWRRWYSSAWPLPFGQSLWMALGLSTWLFWFAFPYLGEGI
jgi:hypothetical protein